MITETRHELASTLGLNEVRPGRPEQFKSVVSQYADYEQSQ